MACLSKFLSYLGKSSSCALLKYDVNPIIRRLNLSIFLTLPVYSSIKIFLNSSNVSGSAVLTVNVAEFAIAVISLAFNNLTILFINSVSVTVPRSSFTSFNSFNSFTLVVSLLLRLSRGSFVTPL